MGIQKQIRKSIIANALLSIALIAVIVSGIMIAFFKTYQNLVVEKGARLINDGSISVAELKEVFQSVDLQHLFFGNSRAPLFPILCIVTIVVVVSVSALFSHITSKMILVPIRQLESAANHVAEGDLDYEISYCVDNEFDSVRDAFNEMQVKLKGSIQENIRQEQSKQELIAGVSHDLRTPLTSIKGYVRGLQDGVASTPEKLYRYLDTISAKTNEMEVMIDKLFMFSKLDTGEEPIRMEKIVPTEYVEGYLSTVQEDMRHRGLEVTYRCDIEQSVSLEVDCDQMSRVFANILENSAKYKNREIGNVEITSTISEDGKFVLRFQDDGPGVSEELRLKMFDSFYRGDPSRTSNVKGSGLGLAISERIVKAHGGTITAESEEGNGLAIVISLPVVNTNITIVEGQLA